MKFCENCDNMLYLKIVQDETNGDAKSLNYICKNCNNEIEHNTTDSSCIFKIDYNKAKPEIIYIKYDNEDLKFIYICLDCYRAKNTPHIW